MPRAPAHALPFVPRGLSREQAAAYVGIGATLFDRAVADGKMPAQEVQQKSRGREEQL